MLTTSLSFAELKEGALGARSPSVGTPIDRSATPTPASVASAQHDSGSSSNALASSTGAPIARSGLLVIRVIDAKGLSLPPGQATPPAIARALSQSRTSSSLATSFAGTPNSASGGNNRQSMQRKNGWWLPYLVLEFDKNEVLIDAMGGDVQAPTWMYKANL